MLNLWTHMQALVKHDDEEIFEAAAQAWSCGVDLITNEGTVADGLFAVADCIAKCLPPARAEKCKNFVNLAKAVHDAASTFSKFRDPDDADHSGVVPKHEDVMKMQRVLLHAKTMARKKIEDADAKFGDKWCHEIEHFSERLTCLADMTVRPIFDKLQPELEILNALLTQDAIQKWDAALEENDEWENLKTVALSTLLTTDLDQLSTQSSTLFLSIQNYKTKCEEYGVAPKDTAEYSKIVAKARVVIVYKDSGET